MAYLTRRYTDYIKSARWKRKRQDALRYYGRKCQACHKRPKVLHVHHRSYRNLGNEKMADLCPLCVSCHKRITIYHRQNRRRGIEFNTAYMIAKIKKENGLTK
jgi:5-methylcytosine-specific restriction endonuclease McrA